MSPKWSLTCISGGFPLTMSPQIIPDLHIWWDSTDNVTSNAPWPPYLVGFHGQFHINDPWPSYLVGFHWQCHVNDTWPPYLVGFHRQCLLKWSVTCISDRIPLKMSPKWTLTSISGGIPLTMSLQMILEHIWLDSTDNVTSNDPWPPYIVGFHWQCHLNDHWPPYMVGLQWQCHVNDPWPPYLEGFHWQWPLKWSLTSISCGIMSPKWSLTCISGGFPLTMSPQIILDLHIWWDSTDNVTSNAPWPPYLVGFHGQFHINDPWPSYLVGFHWQCHLNDTWPPYLVGFHQQCLLKWSVTCISDRIPLIMSPKWFLTSISGGISLTLSPEMILDLHIWWNCTENVT